MGRQTRKAAPAEIAVAYDFDGTLCDRPMQDYRLLPELGYPDAAAIKKFWRQSNRIAKREKARSDLRVHARTAGGFSPLQPAAHPETAGRMRQGGAAAPGADRGPATGLPAPRKIAAGRGFTLRHYIISSGLAEIIAGTSIAKWFAPDRIFASRYLYDRSGSAIAPAWTINHTTKTQFLFRINKGVLDLGDAAGINDYVPEHRRPVPFSRIIFIGDGTTDIPCFSIVRRLGGFALAVFAADALADNHDQITGLINDKRIDGVGGGDFRAGSTLEGLFSRFIDEVGGTAG